MEEVPVGRGWDGFLTLLVFFFFCFYGNFFSVERDPCVVFFRVFGAFPVRKGGYFF